MINLLGIKQITNKTFLKLTDEEKVGFLLFVRDEITNKSSIYLHSKKYSDIGDEISVVQTTGSSTTNVMSQNGVTIALDGINSHITDTLLNHYLKTETLNTSEITTLINKLSIVSFEIVENLPTTDIGTTIIYLIKNAPPSNSYTQHMFINGAWFVLGTTEIDLTKYYTKVQVDTKITDVFEGKNFVTKAVADNTYLNKTNDKNDLISLIYPVGSIYLSVNSSNPKLLFGIGTWSLIGEGKALVGVDTNNPQYNTPEKTGGNSNVTLATEHLPTHNHTLNSDGGHTHSFINTPVAITHDAQRNYSVSRTDGTILAMPVCRLIGSANNDGGYDEMRLYNSAGNYQTQDDVDWMEYARATLTPTGGGVKSIEANGAHSHTINSTGSKTPILDITNPYITCYMWKRLS